MIERVVPVRRALALLCLVAAFAGAPAVAAWTARAAELDGIEMPASSQAAGRALRLNGMGLRAYSVFGIPIYVAGLYLEAPTSDADAILRSDGAKLLVIRFLHHVTADQARIAWTEGFQRNCRPPCHLRDDDLRLFMSGMPDFRRDDESTLLFTGRSVEIALNGRPLGSISDGEFARAVLATFIGPSPPTEPLKRGLLGLTR
jgi:hypothetical protein